LVEVDLLQVVIPLVALVIPFTIVFIGRFNKTQDGTITGTIKIEGLKSNIDNVREEVDKGFSKLETILNERYVEMHSEFSRVNNKLASISAKIDLHEYRLDRLEKDSSRNNNGNNSINFRRQDKGGGPVE